MLNDKLLTILATIYDKYLKVVGGGLLGDDELFQKIVNSAGTKV